MIGGRGGDLFLEWLSRVMSCLLDVRGIVAFDLRYPTRCAMFSLSWGDALNCGV